MTQSERVLEIARGELGRTELPAGSNNTPYGAAYGLQGQPWCVIFLWWCFREAKLSRLFFGGAKTARCGTLLRWAEAEGLTVPVSDIRAGDIVILNFHGSRDTEHCGIVLSVNSINDNYINTIEGNTTPGDEGSQDNGGCVALKHRPRWQIVAVIRPRYEMEPEAAEAAAADYLGRWSTEFIREAMADGIMEGDPDGKFRPRDPVTREELAAFWHKMKKREENR